MFKKLGEKIVKYAEQKAACDCQSEVQLQTSGEKTDKSDCCSDKPTKANNRCC